MVDGSHNPQAAGVLAGAIAEAWPDAGRRPVLVLGVLADKDVAGIVRSLEPVAGGFIATEPESPRALSAADLASVIAEVTGAGPIETLPLVAALETAASRPAGAVVAGSITTAGQARALLRRGSRQGSRRRAPSGRTAGRSARIRA